MKRENSNGSTTSYDIVALGDSITYGYPYTPQQSWVALVAARLRLAILNQGINGDTTAGMLGRFTQDVLCYYPKRVIIMGGTNDAYFRGLKAELVVGHLASMTELARQNGIEVSLGLPIPCEDVEVEAQLLAYREAMKQYVAREQLTLLDFSPVFLNGEDINTALFDDSAHPNVLGYRRMADVAASFLANLI